MGEPILKNTWIGETRQFRRLCRRHETSEAISVSKRPRCLREMERNVRISGYTTIEIKHSRFKAIKIKCIKRI